MKPLHGPAALKETLLKGSEAFRRFVFWLLASQARNGLPEPDGSIPPLQTVTRGALLDRFLALRPDLKPFRAELDGAFDKELVPEFCVNSIRWEQLVIA
jgi:hypothetical protein